MKKRFGFTLAEVLITLGIIGVVAAMTIPTLIQNTNSTKWTTQYKKSFAALTNAAEMAVAQHDLTFNMYSTVCADGTARTHNLDSPVDANRQTSICGFINATLSNVRYIGTGARAYTAANGLTGTNPWDRGKRATGTANTVLIYALADGSWLAVSPAVKTTCTVQTGTDPATLGAACKGFIDVNGAAAPNNATACAGADPGVASSGLTDSRLCAGFRSSDVSDIFPIVFHDGTVSPGSTVARLLLSKSK